MTKLQKKTSSRVPAPPSPPPPRALPHPPPPAFGDIRGPQPPGPRCPRAPAPPPPTGAFPTTESTQPPSSVPGQLRPIPTPMYLRQSARAGKGRVCFIVLSLSLRPGLFSKVPLSTPLPLGAIRPQKNPLQLVLFFVSFGTGRCFVVSILVICNFHWIP